MTASRFRRLLWVMLLLCAFMAFDGERAEAEESLASWYGPGFGGRPTASGEIYDPNGLTAAHKTLPLGTEIVVSYEGRSVPVTITDRGPFVGERELDLSQGAARELGFTKVGVDYVDWSLADPQSLPQGVAQQPVPPVAQEPGIAPVAQGPELAPTGLEAEYAGYPRSYPPDQDPVNNGAYTVQPGDTLASIAARSGTSVDDLASRNGITDPNLVYSGQALYFPLLVEDPTEASGYGTTTGSAVTQSLPSVGGGAHLGGGDVPVTEPVAEPVAGPVSGPVTSAFPGGTAAPMVA